MRVVPLSPDPGVVHIWIALRSSGVSQLGWVHGGLSGWVYWSIKGRRIIATSGGTLTTAACGEVERWLGEYETEGGS